MFCWFVHLFQGRHTSQDEVTACAFQAVTLDQKYDNAPVQVRVTMGKEPKHFMAMFKGKMVVFEVHDHIYIMYTQYITNNA